MFEMGVKLQVLKRGTMFPMRAQKLHDLYTQYDSIDDIPTDERQKLESQVFKASLERNLGWFVSPFSVNETLNNW